MGIPERTYLALHHLVKGMYALLFPPGFLDTCSSSEVDPRIESFEPSKWVEVFKDSYKFLQTQGANMPCLGKLRNFVSSTSDRRISFITQLPPLEQDSKVLNYTPTLSNDSFGASLEDASYYQTPTKSGSKRHSGELSIHSRFKRSRNRE
ncbi:hypothetical protein COEREDRAFT_11294 [Coemansia reversa NRRL 1564]|uniref:Uncharacterized protein n=1 Tax=Coemansia reversa (strain ATCC 12441 / NRRL 1564) TaxID=763665 RepID=A0A2G5B3E5_COERN|nr:hypothetical protein COEREDRAFT_11294 [Coemansia reversa NRRL 1564]|eukprot:PIA13539.1 hypothetical protein COEREDRAFT_11294 [Coemansia reversa NRRL 1564]